MWWGLFAATLCYFYGHPSLDGWRPSTLDRPLQEFHRELNAFAIDGKRALETLDDARSMRYLKDYVTHMNESLGGQ
jgi:hypothetical protein